MAEEPTDCRCAATERDIERTRCRSDEDLEGRVFSGLKVETREEGRG